MSKTHIAIILDMSGSMTKTVEATKSGIKEYIRKTRREIPDARFSLTVFDDQIEEWVVDARLSDIRASGVIENYRPRNMTALYDAIGETTIKLRRRVKKKDKAIVVIMTDGYENASRRNSLFTIKNMIQELQAKGNWTFVFLGANIDSFGVGEQLGIWRGNTANYTYGVGQFKAFDGVALASVGLSGSRSASTTTIYEDANIDTSEFVEKEGVKSGTSG